MVFNSYRNHMESPTMILFIKNYMAYILHMFLWHISSLVIVWILEGLIEGNFHLIRGEWYWGHSFPHHLYLQVKIVYQIILIRDVCCRQFDLLIYPTMVVTMGVHVYGKVDWCRRGVQWRHLHWRISAEIYPHEHGINVKHPPGKPQLIFMDTNREWMQVTSCNHIYPQLYLIADETCHTLEPWKPSDFCLLVKMLRFRCNLW